MGLSLVKESGRTAWWKKLRWTPNPDKAARFTVTLPRQAAKSETFAESAPSAHQTAAPSASNAESVPPDNGTTDTSRPTILVADDNRDMRAFIRSTLGQRYQVIEACNGDEALALCRERLPDLVILDVMMPERDGFSAGREIQADPTPARHSDGFFDRPGGPRKTTWRGLAAGAVRFILTQPFEPDTTDNPDHNSDRASDAICA